MSAFGSGSIANYSAQPLLEGYAKKVISHQGANGQIVISSADRTSGTWSAPITQPYNNFVIQKGFPIQQGQIMNVKLAEVRFPYAIPNVNDYNNKFIISLATGSAFSIAITPGFYTGTTLATAVNSAVSARILGTPPSLAFNADGTFTWTAFDETVASKFYLAPLFTYENPDDAIYQTLNTSINTPCLLSLMGFNPTYQDFTVAGYTFFSQVAPLVYTRWIDICSDVLTQYQDLPDSSTSTPNLQHVICRLLIANETSTTTTDASGFPVYPGMNPFIIHRQFKNAKVMKWNGQNSIDRIDIKLYDDAGRPLYLGARSVALSNNKVCEWDDFQLIFHSAE